MIFKASFMLVLLFAVTSLSSIQSHAVEYSPAELYWKAKLGNIPMPKVLKNCLQIGSNEMKLNRIHTPSSVYTLSKTKYSPNDQLSYERSPANLEGSNQLKLNRIHRPSSVFTLSKTQYSPSDRLDYEHSSANLEGSNEVKLKHIQRPYNKFFLSKTEYQRGDQLSYGPSTADLHGSNEVKLNHIQRPYNKFFLSKTEYERGDKLSYGPSSADLDDYGKYDPPKDEGVLYFTEEVLFKAYSKMRLQFENISNNEAKFLPSKFAKMTPISSSNNLQVILNLLSVNPKSVVANDIEKTISLCQAKGVKDEVRFCVTSMEAMINNVVSKSSLNSAKNKGINVFSTEVEDENVVEYRIIKKAEKVGNNEDNNLVCHKMSNPYAVFLCHNIKKTDAYEVSLVGANGKLMKAMAVCHKDTSSWNPNHLAFRVLKIKPGSMPICHFLGANAMVWVRD